MDYHNQYGYIIVHLLKFTIKRININMIQYKSVIYFNVLIFCLIGRIMCT